ncbi:cornichon [Mycena epipterygia]|nr:cornichon [Mycena epipterygia]
MSFLHRSIGLLLILSALLAIGLSMCMVIFLLMFQELEINLQSRKHDEQKEHAKNLSEDRCKTFNKFVLPEIIAHAYFVALFLLSKDWTTVLLNAPLLAYNANKVRSNTHIYAPATLYKNMPGYKKETWLKLAFYVFSFFYYLYCMILARRMERRY